MKFLVRLALVSETVTEDRPCIWHDDEDTCAYCPDEDNVYREVDRFMYKDYYATDGSAVFLKENLDFDYASTPFSLTELIDGTELPLFDSSWFSLVEQDENGVSYQLQPRAEVIVESATEQEAQEKCQISIPRLFEIFNRASEGSAALAIKAVEIFSVTQK